VSNSTAAPETAPLPATADWKHLVAKYQEPSTGRAFWQIVNSVGSYLALWAFIYWSLDVSYWLTAPLVVVTAGVYVRVFIIFHDCGHGSFLRSKRANDIIGFVTGVLTFTPYHHWRWEHARHHASVGDLDRRGTGDVWTMTVEEYLAAPLLRRLAYRIVRHPLFLFLLAPILLFLVRERFPSANASPRERRSVWWMNLAILGMIVGTGWLFGWQTYLLLQLAIVAVGGAWGVWIFYIQHQFEGVYWERGENWDFTAAALQGSSFYRLPRILQWFSGNIGYHHIHHLSSRIPNYNLERCHRSHPVFQEVKEITLFASLKAITYRLWDEQNRRLVGFGYLRRLRRC
jgi:omega-6 fatty acid desaturase (delta-12 desaturase)